MYIWNLFQKFSMKIFRLPLQKRLALFFTGLCIFALATPQLAPVSAQSVQATVQEILDGNQVFIQNRRASVNDIANQQQQVRTGDSRTALKFNSGAVARLSANSVLTIGQCARLRQGTILINGAVNACSSSITTGVRGTTYLLTVDTSGNQMVKVLEGEVVVKRSANPEVEPETKPTTKPTNPKPTNPKPSINSASTETDSGTSVTPKVKQFSAPPTAPSGNNGNRPILPQTNPQDSQPLDPLNGQLLNDKPILKVDPNLNAGTQLSEIVLKAGEKVEVDPIGALGIIQKLTENEFVQLLQSELFKGFTNQIPGIDKVRDVFNGLFPGANFPISLPNIPTPNIPSIPIPSLPF